MAYTWETGEVITAEKLNNTCDVFLVNVSYTAPNDDTLIADKTFTEISNAIDSGNKVVLASLEGIVLKYVDFYTEDNEESFVVFSDVRVTGYADGESVTITNTTVTISDSNEITFSIDNHNLAIAPDK